MSEIIKGRCCPYCGDIKSSVDPIEGCCGESSAHFVECYYDDVTFEDKTLSEYLDQEIITQEWDNYGLETDQGRFAWELKTIKNIREGK